LTLLTVLPNAHILLIGARASGKSTIGQMLARDLGRPFVELDTETLREFQQPTIAQAWAVHGEQRWREAEHAALARVLGRKPSEPLVLALGGGTPLIPDARHLLAQARLDGSAMILYLRCSVAVLKQRLIASARQTGEARPPILGHDSVEEVNAIVAAREPAYLALASDVVDADISLERTLASVLAALQRLEPP
jgi:shikimate kinase